MAQNHDDLMKQIAQDELEDKSHSITKMSPMEYARARRMQPQLVYYYIRTGKLKDENCICGRRVIDVIEADAFFKSREKK